MSVNLKKHKMGAMILAVGLLSLAGTVGAEEPTISPRADGTGSDPNEASFCLRFSNFYGGWTCSQTRLERAREICEARGWNLPLVRADGSPGNAGWSKPCAAVDRRWREEGYADRERREREARDARELDLVRGVAGERR